jgi:hypothetical protein
MSSNNNTATTVSLSNVSNATGSNLIWTISLTVVSIIILIFVGVEFSKSIGNYSELIIFWFLYSITIFTIINIIVSGYFYFVLKDKKGPSGERGETGEPGGEGEAGLCDIGCRNKICTDKIMTAIVDQINDEAGNPDPPIKLNNVYIKQRVKQICNSSEYNEYSPFRGPNDLIKYLANTWRKWVSVIYKAGGRQYFESIGAENEWKWVKENPFNEIKKYDVFYWGMAKGYKPKIHEKCQDKPQATIPPGIQKGYPDSRIADTNTARGFIGHPQSDKKYSIQTYLNLIPEGYLIHTLTKTKFYIKTLDANTPNVYQIKRYNEISKKYDLCVSLNKGKFLDIQCNAVDNSQNWAVVFTGDRDHEVRVKALSADAVMSEDSNDDKQFLNVQTNPLDQSGSASLLFSTINESAIDKLNSDNDGTLFIMRDS